MEHWHPWDFPWRDGWGHRGVPRNAVPVGFVLGEKPELSTAAETRAFLTSRLLSTAPAHCQGEICHIHLTPQNPAHQGEGPDTVPNAQGLITQIIQLGVKSRGLFCSYCTGQVKASRNNFFSDFLLSLGVRGLHIFELN